MAFGRTKPLAVLVVDDDEFVRKVVTRQLEDLGATVSVAGNGKEARESLRERGPFELVISDLQMPDMDGIELLRDFADLQPAAALVLMSSVDATTLEAAELLARTRELRYLGSLRKPVSPAAFKALLEKLEETPAPKRIVAPPQPLPAITQDDLRHAIARGEIDVYAQPKVDVATGSLVGAEALARWLRPDGSVASPAVFIEPAERWGLMPELTRLVLRQAFAGCALWRDAGLVLDIAVNIPPSCLGQLDLPESIAAEAARHGLDPGQVVLEITESSLMNDAADLLDVVTRMRLRGFHLSVDDFGTGYSSLERLKRLPFTELKVDRAFVNGCARDDKLRSIVDSTVRLARALRLSTCAEGVESQADLEVIRELGCDVAQGYFYGKPMPKQALPAWAAGRSSGGMALRPGPYLAKRG